MQQNIMQTQDSSQQTAPEAPKKSGLKRLIFLILIWILVAVIAAVIVIGVGIYKFGWSGPAIEKIEVAIPYPAAMVNWRIVSLNDFADRFAAFKRAVVYNQAYDFDAAENQEEVKTQKQNILSRMVDLKLEAILAARKKVSVTQEQIDKELGMIETQFGNNAEELNKMLSEVYGWSRQEFIDQIVAPQILEQNLQGAVNADKIFNSEAYAKTEEVLQKLSAGQDFAQLAAEYSTDTSSAQTGGDLGWAPKGAFVPSFENAVFALEPNQVSDVVVTSYGLHIIQLLEKTGVDGDEQVHARHILISTRSYGEWLNAEREKATIWKFPIN